MKINNPPGRNWLPPRRAFLLAVLARTTVPFPGVPANLKLHKLDSHSAQFRWSGAANATSYNLYRATQSGGPYTLVDPVNQPNYIGTTAIDCELDPETSYWYVVSGVNERGESATSAEVAVNTPNRAEDMIQNAGFWAPDNTNEVIQAHAGFIAKFGDTYYWYGEDKRHNSARLRAVSIYVSQDLVHWEFRNNALTPDSDPELSEDNPVGAKIERPKALYNDATGMYVLWGHKEPRANYNEARVCVAVSATPDGEFSYLGSFQPDPDKDGAGDESRDFTVFKDEDGTGYLISSTRGNRDLAIYRLTPDYLDVEERILTLYEGLRREAPAIVKKDGIYYMFHSGQSGWAPSQGKYSIATSMAGPWTEGAALPLFGGNWSFYTQPAFIMTVPGTETTSYIYVGDRWHPTRLGASEYVWLPLTLNNGTASMEYVPQFKFDVITGKLIVPEVQLISGKAIVTADRSSASRPAAHANDADYSTYWESSNKTLPVSVNVDLVQGQPIGRVDLTWRGIGGSEAYYQYKLYGSTDNANFTELADRSTNEDLGFTSDTLTPGDNTPYRYLRITVSRYVNFTNGNTPGYNPGLYEIKVYSKAAPTVMVAAGGTINNESSGTFNLGLLDVDSPVDGLAPTASSSNSSLVPGGNITFGGSGANRTVTISLASAKVAGEATVTVTVSDGLFTTELPITVIAGGNGNDVLYGTSGADLIFGGNGDDTLFGDSGNDLLSGERGVDILIGEGGADVFNGGQGEDIAMDYTPGEGDHAMQACCWRVTA